MWYECGMQSTGVWSLNHVIISSLGPSHIPQFSKNQKSTPTCTGITRVVRVHPHNSIYAQTIHSHSPQHIKVQKLFEHCVYMWYGCGMQSTGVWSLNHDTTKSFVVRIPQVFTKIHLPTVAQVLQWNGAPTCPSTVHSISKWYDLYAHGMDVGWVYMGLEFWPWHYNAAWSQPYPNFPKNYPCWETPSFSFVSIKISSSGRQVKYRLHQNDLFFNWNIDVIMR